MNFQIVKTIRVVNATTGGFVIGAVATIMSIEYLDVTGYKMSPTAKNIVACICGIPLGIYGFHLAIQKN